MMTHKIPTAVDYNLLLKRLDNQLNEPTNQNSKSPKLLSQRIRKHYYKTFGICVLNSPMSPPFLPVSEKSGKHFQKLQFLFFAPELYKLENG